MILLLSGCLSSRKVSKMEDKFKGFENTTTQRKSPGDKIYIEIPRTPNERPKSETVTYIGDKGATSKKTFNESGYVVTDLIDCPEVDEIEQKNLEWERDQSSKQTERAFNIALGKLISNTLIWISVIWAIAWIIKGWMPNPKKMI